MTTQADIATLEQENAAQAAQVAALQQQVDQLSPYYQAAQQASGLLADPAAQAGQQAAPPIPVYAAPQPVPKTPARARFLLGAAAFGLILFVANVLRGNRS